MLFFSLFVVPVVMFLTIGMLRAPAATFRFCGVFLLVLSVPPALVVGACWMIFGYV